MLAIWFGCSISHFRIVDRGINDRIFLLNHSFIRVCGMNQLTPSAIFCASVTNGRMTFSY